MKADGRERNDSSTGAMNSAEPYDLIIVGCGPSASAFLAEVLSSQQSAKESYRICVVTEGSSSSSCTGPTPPLSHSQLLSHWPFAAHGVGSPRLNSPTSPSSAVHLMECTVCGDSLPVIMESPRALQHFGPPASCVSGPPSSATWPGGANAGLWFGPQVSPPPSRSSPSSLWSAVLRRSRAPYAEDAEDDVRGAGEIPTVPRPSFVRRFSSSTLCTSPRHDFGYSDSFYVSADVDGSFYKTAAPASGDLMLRIPYFSGLVSPLIIEVEAKRRYASISNSLVTIDVLAPVGGVDKVLLVFSNKGPGKYAYVAGGVMCKDGANVRLKSFDGEEGEEEEKGEKPPPSSPRPAVVLCCGAVMTPAILIKSSIRPYALEPSSISAIPGPHLPIFDDPLPRPLIASNHVGQHLKEHVILPRLLISPFKALKRRGVRSPNGVLGHWDGSSPKIGVPGVSFVLMSGGAGVKLLSVLIPQIFRRRYEYNFDEAEAVVSGTSTSTYTIVNTSRGLMFGCVMFMAWVVQKASAFIHLLLRWCFRITVNYLLPDFVERWIDDHVVSLNVCLVHSTSEGSVKLNDKGEPEIKMSFLDTKEDFNRMQLGFTRSSALIQGGEIEGLEDCYEMVPGKLYRSLLTLDSYVNHFATSFYHLHGTAAMGQVVDDESCCVLGTANLMVVDASVFPECVSAPLARTCVALGGIVGERFCTGKSTKVKVS